MPDLIGQTIGGYRIIERIGLGGMATVFKAYQPSMDRYVALKLLSTHLSQDATFVQRFRQEAKVIARLEHVYILPVYDHGEEDDHLYLVIRYIEAGTLKDRLEGDPLSLAEIRHIVDQVGSALEYAHHMGVVHRDLKPSNILVDSQGDCYLTDFGIAKMVESSLGLTGSSVLGTPHYMAPEQSQALEVDRRADVYAMGVILYEMVTGQVPFDAETPFAVVMKHLTEPLPLPRSLRPDLPESVERVILKALAKAPDDRFQSMRALVASFNQAVVALDQAVAQGPTASAEPVAAATEAAGEAITVEAPEGGETARVSPPVLAPTTPAPPPRRQWLAGQSRWMLAAAGLGLVLLVVVGLILSRLPDRMESDSGPVGAAPPTATASPGASAATDPVVENEVAVVEVIPTDTATASAAATAAPTQSATATPNPSPTHTPPPTATPVGAATGTAYAAPTPTRTRPPTRTPFPPDAVVSAEAANLRSGPGTNYDIVGQLERGDELRVVGRNAEGDWLRVGQTGSSARWVSVSLLDLNVDLDDVALFRSPPTPTTSPADQARAFAGPILAAIADRPPDYQDDFSNPGSGWGQGTIIHPNGWEEGEAGYLDGEYFVRAAPAKLQPQSPDRVTCASALGSPAPAFSDMVLEVEGRFVQVENGDWQLNFRSNEETNNALTVGFWEEGGVWLTSFADPEINTLADWQGFPVRGELGTNRLQLVVVGPQVAIYVNGEPVLFGIDPYYTEGYAGSPVRLSVCNFADTPLEARWDNLRIWDISDLSSE